MEYLTKWLIGPATKGKALVIGAIAALTTLWGWFGWLVVAFVGCMTMDWVTGSLAARAQGEWRSARARSGIWHKVGMIAGVLVACIADGVIGLMITNLPGIDLPFVYSVLISPFALLWYIFTELGSVLENVERLGAPLPPFLRKAIVFCKGAVEQARETGEE